ncbi:MAG: DUF1016 family protein [Bacilli bacterium]|nr:DUF1016 family protein [Bacilli bacterium]
MNYYNQIKEELVNNQIYKKVKDYSKNKNDLNTYYNVGKLLIEAQGGEKRAKYGDSLIKEYSKKLTKELGKGYSIRSLKYMRNFYLFIQKGQTMSAQLTWSHYVELLKFKDINKIAYYINISNAQKLAVRELRLRIKNNEYERLSIEIKLGDRYNYIDLLLFNYKYNCFVVIELKVTELKTEHIGQIKKYMNYIDKNVKNIEQENTIGIIICKKDNAFVMEYCSDSRIFNTMYNLV